MTTNKTPLYLSLALLVYFVLLLSASVFEWDFVLIGVFVELLTLPALAGGLALFGYSIYRSLSGDAAQRSVYRQTTGVLTLCALLLIIGTIYLD